MLALTYIQYGNVSSFDSQGRPLEPRTLTVTRGRHLTRDGVSFHSIVQ